ncbi:uncharacterized protein LOC106142352 [Amyelois transitella]|uniref:uncharacterized protein LOC106142352 n=1 Tax=Amyelois transitella TaxID=680683 RepID=UPI00067C5D1E|nr:uncharacterized protein LOC106142352 [Amyelois transitella]
MKSTISDSAAFKLIKLVKSRPYIWNMNYEKYNDRFHVAISWKEIQEALSDTGLSEDALRLKWRNYRDIFRRELRKYPCHSPEDYGGKWQFFRAMFFLKTELYEKETEQYLAEKNEEDKSDNEEPHFVVKFEPQEDEAPPIDFVSTTSDDDERRSKRRRVDKNDYDQMFLKSLVPYFRQLEPMRKLAVRTKLQNLLFEELKEQAESKEDDF